MKSGKLLIGLVTGLAVGAITGILLAPDKGSKTRKQIKNKGEHYLDELKDTYQNLSKKLTKKNNVVVAELDETLSN